MTVRNKKFFLLVLTLFCSSVLFSAQAAVKKPGKKAVVQTEEMRVIANLTTSMLTKMHYVKRDISPENSQKLLESYLKTLDPFKLYFTQDQIDYWKLRQSTLLPSLAATGDVSIAFAIFNEYLRNLEEYEKFVKAQKFSKADFETSDLYQFDRSKAPWAKNRKELHAIWRQKLKNDLIAIMLQDRIREEEQKKEKKAVTAPRKSPEERIRKRVSQFVLYNRNLEPIEVLELYLNSLARLFDPHTNYMAPRTEEDFNIGMQLSLVGIGAVLTSEDGYTKIVQIIPGGPADLDKRLKAEDRIIAVAQENGDAVDVIDMPLTKVVSMIRGAPGTKVKLTILEGVKGAKAVPVTIELTRNKVELKESEAKGKVHTIRNAEGEELRIGVITLPSFYADFQAASSGDPDYKSSTRDVRDLIRSFKKQGRLDGLVIDLRSNGGGSLQEAVSLTGLFIKEGPVVQIRDSSGLVSVYQDEDPSVEYTGPLLVMTNRLSASASEIFSGAIKDYKRGVIVGDQKTHGKGSVQTVADLGNYLRYLGYNFPAGSIKLTNAKFYRINGESTQLKGVPPDIAFPTFTDTMETGEDKLENAIAWDAIREVAHTQYEPTIANTIAELKKRSDERVRNSRDFTMLKRDIAYLMKNKGRKTITLNLEQRWKEYLREKDIYEEQTKLLHLDTPDPKKKNDKKDLYLEETPREFLILQRSDRSLYEITGVKRSSIGYSVTKVPAGAERLNQIEEVILHNVPEIIDVENMLHLASELGALVRRENKTVILKAENLKTNRLPQEICSALRTSLLFAGPVAVRTGEAVLWPPGGDVIGRRRLDAHFYGLRKLGIQIESEEIPYVFHRTSRRSASGADLFLDEASVTATEHIMTTAAQTPGTTILRNAASEPHIEQLAGLLIKMGAEISGIGTNTLVIRGKKKLHGAEHTVEGDHIEAASFLALCAAAGGEIEINGIFPTRHFWMTRRVFERFGLTFRLEPNRIHMKGRTMRIRPDFGNAIPTISDGPWPQFPSDMMSCMIVAATQARGSVLFFEKMFESRIYFVDRIIAMGANAIVCDPHRVVISGPARLRGTTMSSPDIRAGMAMIIAGACAHGTSVINHAEIVFRGYENLPEKLTALGIRNSLAEL